MSDTVKSTFLKVVARFVALVMLGTCVAPALQAQGYYDYGQPTYYTPATGGHTQAGWDDRGEYSDGGEMGRTVGGSVGMAAGFVGGAALAAAVTSAGAIASMGPLAVMVIGAAITMGGGFLGGKLLSNAGQWMTRTLGKKNTWMMLGATIGTIAAIALIPALGPFVGAGGLILKGVIGGLAGGVLGRLFANQLEALATPRMLMAGMGAVLGGLAGNIPGALAGAAGGYALGAIFDDHFFAQPDDSVGKYLPNLSRIQDSISGAWNRITNWTKGKADQFQNQWNDRWYDEGTYVPYQDPYYHQSYQMAYGYDYGNPFDQSYQYQQGYYPQVQDYRTNYTNTVGAFSSGQMTPQQMQQYYQQYNGAYQNYQQGWQR